jgi:hypothetical protein
MARPAENVLGNPASVPMDPASVPMGVLRPNETVLWHGKPRKGFRVVRADLVRTPFGLVLLAVFGDIVIKRFPISLLLPHFWIAVYFAVGGSLFDTIRRARTAYFLTSTRAIIVREWPRRSVQTQSLPCDFETSSHRDGTTSIAFDPKPGRGASRTPTFRFVEDASSVLAVLARTPPERSELEGSSAVFL